MNKQAEKWALIAMLVGGSVLLVGEVLDGNVVRSLLWLAAVVVVGSVFLLSRRVRGREH